MEEQPKVKAAAHRPTIHISVPRQIRKALRMSPGLQKLAMYRPSILRPNTLPRSQQGRAKCRPDREQPIRWLHVGNRILGRHGRLLQLADPIRRRYR